MRLLRSCFFSDPLAHPPFSNRFSNGLILMDSYHLPTGCGTWPAWWSFNLDWPYHGEIDILEGIHRSRQNKISIHSGDGCTLTPYIDQTQQGVLDLVPSTPTPSFDPYDCYALAGGDSGCGVLDETSDGSFGDPFNKQKGGVYARTPIPILVLIMRLVDTANTFEVLWTKQTIQVYFFPRHAIPSDIECDKPDPTTWPTPIANYTSPSCSPAEYFQDHFSVFDTTLCGQWAGNLTTWQGTLDGQTGGSCAAQTGYDTCEDYVLNEGEAFKQAYWEVSHTTPDVPSGRADFKR